MMERVEADIWKEGMRAARKEGMRAARKEGGQAAHKALSE
jgi:hypothetical protein